MTTEKDWQAHLADIAVEAEKLAGERNPAKVAELATRAFGCGLWAALTPEVVAASCKASVELGTPVLASPCPIRCLLATEETLTRAGVLGWAPRQVRPPDLVAVPDPIVEPVEPSPVAKRQRPPRSGGDKGSYPRRLRYSDSTEPPAELGADAVQTRAIAAELQIATKTVSARARLLGIPLHPGQDRAVWLTAADADRLREAITRHDHQRFPPVAAGDGAVPLLDLVAEAGTSARAATAVLASLGIEAHKGQYKVRWIREADVEAVRAALAERGSRSRAPAALGPGAVELSSLARELGAPTARPLMRLLEPLGIRTIGTVPATRRWVSRADADRLRALIDPAADAVGDQTGLVAEPVSHGLGTGQPEG